MVGITLPKTDPLNIPDPLYRAQFYKEIRAGSVGWDRWEISIDEQLKPELISLRYYGSANFKYIVAISAGLDDLRARLQAGTQVALPPARWIRQRIRHYMTISTEDAAPVLRQSVAVAVKLPDAVKKQVRKSATYPQTYPTCPPKTSNGLPSLSLLLEAKNG